MEITIRTTQRHFDIKDLTEVDMAVLDALLNWDDKRLIARINEQKGEWEGNWLEPQMIESAQNLRNEISRALED